MHLSYTHDNLKGEHPFAIGHQFIITNTLIKSNKS